MANISDTLLLRATGLLVFVRVVTFHTASPIAATASQSRRLSGVDGRVPVICSRDWVVAVAQVMVDAIAPGSGLLQHCYVILTPGFRPCSACRGGGGRALMSQELPSCSC